MNPALSLLGRLAAQGVELEANGDRLKIRAERPPDDMTLALIRENREGLLQLLSNEGNVPLLPWQLEALLRAACSDQLPKGSVKLTSGLVPDLKLYVLACATSYLLGDRDEVVRRLWEAHRAWQGGVN